MEKGFLFLLALFLFFISCEDDIGGNGKSNIDVQRLRDIASGNDVRYDDENYLNISGFTTRDNMGRILNSNDPDDWNLDDEFTEREKMLFDTLDFTRTGIVEPVIIEDGYFPLPDPYIMFYPNPFGQIASIGYYHNDHIVNLAIVDSKYKKLYSFRIENNPDMAFDFEKLAYGTYRMYYVIQDKNYNIVHCGHGDIQKK